MLMANFPIQRKNTRLGCYEWRNRVVLAALIFSLLICLGNSSNTLQNKSELPQIYTIEVVKEYLHDPEAFTQGLLYAGNGILYESTGLYGRSSVRKVALQTGEILNCPAEHFASVVTALYQQSCWYGIYVTVEDQHSMDKSLFGEGLTLLHERLYQVTWLQKTGFIYSVDNLSKLSNFTHQMNDGWGLATDGKILFGSDGSSTLYQMDPQTMKVLKKQTIRYGDVEVFNLNELEYVDGEVWANVWGTDCIARIDPAKGTLTGWILLPSLREGLIGAGYTGIDVLNGIAWDAAGQRIFVTGKLWPKLFEIKVHPRKDQSHLNIQQLCIPEGPNTKQVYA